MKAAPQAQQLLLDLQAIDTSTAQIRHRRQTLPEIAELQQKQAVRARLGEEVVAVKTRLSDLDSAQAKVEADLVPVRERLARNRQRVDAGAISDPKALQAMLGEIEHLDGRIDELEYQQLELMEEIDGVQRELDEASARKIDVENEMRTLIASRDEKFAVLDAELAQRATAGGHGVQVPATCWRCTRRSASAWAAQVPRCCGRAVRRMPAPGDQRLPRGDSKRRPRQGAQVRGASGYL